MHLRVAARRATPRSALPRRSPDREPPVADLFTGSLAEPVRLGEHPGQASALKMAFASFQRTSRIAAALAHTLADDHGITEALLTEAQRMPRDILVNRDFLPSVAARAWRWAPEMHEVANTLGAQHLPADLALATAGILQHWADTTGQPADVGSLAAATPTPAVTLGLNSAWRGPVAASGRPLRR